MNQTKIPHPDLIWLNGKEWKLATDFTWSDVTVPIGFVTDGASIPPLLRIWATSTGLNFPAALIHDYRYRMQMGKKKDADVEFYNNLRKLGVRLTKAYVMYFGVKLFGIFAWWKNKRKLERNKDDRLG